MVEEVIEVTDVDVAGISSKVTEAAKEAVEKAAEEMVTLAVSEVKQSMGDLGVSPATLMQVVKYVMEVVEGKPVKGKEQKELALSILGKIVEESDLEDSSKAICNIMIEEGIVGNTIDLVVDASRGKLNINQAADVAVGCIGALVQMFCKPKKRRINN
jgi:nucleotide-binding universal stress UspA family protein